MSIQASPKTRLGGTIAASLLTAVAVATAALGWAPTAKASCASFFGFGGGKDCSSTRTSVAVAIGKGALAQADGKLGAAFSLGAGAQTSTSDAFTFATAVGPGSVALAGGLFGIATAVGPNGTNASTDGGKTLGNLGLNVALNVAPGNKSGNIYSALGIGNLAVNLLGVNVAPSPVNATIGIANVTVNLAGRNNAVGTAYAQKQFFNTAVNILGSDNTVTAGGDGAAFNAAFTVLGKGNTVTAGKGPFALAGSIAQNNKTVTKQRPGLNINGFRIPNTAAVLKPGASQSAPKGSRKAAAVRPPRQERATSNS